jgi:hypothetical protein
VNLELQAPQAEWWELEKQYKAIWQYGMKDKATGAITALPIEEAKQKVLQRNMRSSTRPDAAKAFEESGLRYSDASSGRVLTVRKR